MQPVDMNSLSQLLGRGPMAAWVAGEQNQRSRVSDDLANQLSLENIAKQKLENQITQGGLADLIARPRYVNEQMGAISRSTNLSSDEKQAQLEARKALPDYYTEQAQQERKGLKLETASKSQKVMPILALMSSDPVGFLNAASMSGISPEDAEGFAKGYKAATHGSWRDYVTSKLKENASTEPAVMGHQISAQNQRDIAQMNNETRLQIERENNAMKLQLKQLMAENMQHRVAGANGDPTKLLAIYTDAYNKAVLSGDAEGAQQYAQLANGIKAQAEAALAKGQAAQPDVIKQVMPDVQNKQINIPPVGQGQPQPGQRVRVKSPQGQVGSIPVEQLQEAIQNGYVQVQ